uniref:protein-serine/threonine phosphatase n=1 Tax=Zea mays TaxID=4577 RepID=A0A804N7F4_MAIZE
MGYQVGLHQLLDVLILGFLQGFDNNGFTTFQGSYTGLSCGEIHMELTVELLCIFCSGNHLTVVPSQEIILGIQGEQLRRSRRLDVVQSGCTALSIVKHGDLMVVANVDDSRVVLGIATYDDAITTSSSSST